MSNSAAPNEMANKPDQLLRFPRKPEIPTIRVCSSTNILLDDDKNTELHYAAAQGRDEVFTKELVQHQTIDVENYLGWTPLMMACRNGQASTVKLLLQMSADASRKNKFGYSVFLISVSSGNLEIISLVLNHLLQGGISRRTMQSSLSPLSLAILFHHQNVLEYLVSKSFDLNKSTPFTGITPLMFATAMEDTTAYELLLKNKADKTIKNHLNVTADEIKKARNEKKEPAKESKPLTPAELISMSPHMTAALQSPIYVLNPQASYYLLNPDIQVRRSSNVTTPSPNLYITSPNVTPITPLNYGPQAFFPPDFSPNPYCSFIQASPMTGMVNNSNEFLNMRVNQSNIFLSPMNYPSPCV